MIVKSFFIASNKKNNERGNKISDCRHTKKEKIKNKIKNCSFSPQNQASQSNKKILKQEGFSSALLQFANTLKHKIRVKKHQNMASNLPQFTTHIRPVNPLYSTSYIRTSKDKRQVNKSSINFNPQKQSMNFRYLKLMTNNIFSYVRKGRALSTNNILQQVFNDGQPAEKHHSVKHEWSLQHRKTQQKFMPLGQKGFQSKGSNSKVDLVRQLMKLKELENEEEANKLKQDLSESKKQSSHKNIKKQQKANRSSHKIKAERNIGVFDMRPRSLNVFNSEIRQQQQIFGPWTKV